MSIELEQLKLIIIALLAFLSLRVLTQNKQKRDVSLNSVIKHKALDHEETTLSYKNSHNILTQFQKTNKKQYFANRFFTDSKNSNIKLSQRFNQLQGLTHEMILSQIQQQKQKPLLRPQRLQLKNIQGIFRNKSTQKKSKDQSLYSTRAQINQSIIQNEPIVKQQEYCDRIVYGNRSQKGILYKQLDRYIRYNQLNIMTINSEQIKDSSQKIKTNEQIFLDYVEKIPANNSKKKKIRKLKKVSGNDEVRKENKTKLPQFKYKYYFAGNKNVTPLKFSLRKSLIRKPFVQKGNRQTKFHRKDKISKTDVQMMEIQ